MWSVPRSREVSHVIAEMTQMFVSEIAVPTVKVDVMNVYTSLTYLKFCQADAPFDRLY
jgi:hypothetical protein